MNTLTEYAYLSNDNIVKGIAATILKDCPLFEKLPFSEIQGNSLKYNLESTEAGAQFYQSGDNWAESTPGWEQRSVALAILGGDADVDKYVMQTRSNVMDIEAEVITLKAKAIRDRFLKEMILGYTTTVYDANGFKGLLRLLAECESSSTTDLDGVNNTQVVAAHATSATLTLAMVDELCDKVLGGKPDFLMGSKRTRRKISALCRAGGGNMTFVSTELGSQIAAYNGIAWLDNDFILDNYPNNSSSVLDITAYAQTTTRAADYDNSPIFAFRVGPDALHGIWNGGIMTEQLGTLEGKDASRTRIKIYPALVLRNTKAAAVLIGATDGT